MVTSTIPTEVPGFFSLSPAFSLLSSTIKPLKKFIYFSSMGDYLFVVVVDAVCKYK